MKLGITIDENNGLNSQVSAHFGQCKYFLIADIENGEIKTSKVVGNSAQHGGGGCIAVDEMLSHKITHVIAGGMGMGAQQKFANAGVPIFGYSGKVEDAIKAFLADNLTGINACTEHNKSITDC